jgi:hypothetical protein
MSPFLPCHRDSRIPSVKFSPGVLSTNISTGVSSFLFRTITGPRRQASGISLNRGRRREGEEEEGEGEEGERERRRRGRRRRGRKRRAKRAKRAKRERREETPRKETPRKDQYN